MKLVTFALFILLQNTYALGISLLDEGDQIHCSSGQFSLDFKLVGPTSNPLPILVSQGFEATGYGVYGPRLQGSYLNGTVGVSSYPTHRG